MNKYLKALASLILFSAITHLCILLVYAIILKDINMWNYFKIIELNRIFPGIDQGGFFNVLSVITAVAIYSFFLIKYGYKKE